MEGEKDIIKEFCYPLWLSDQKVPLDAALTEVFNSWRAQGPGQAIADFVHVVGNNGQAFIDWLRRTVYAPMDFAIVVGWKAIAKAIFAKAIDRDLLRLAPLQQHLHAALHRPFEEV